MHLKLKAVARIALTSVCLLGASAALAGGPEQPMHMAPPVIGGFYVEGNFGAFHGTHEYDVHYNASNADTRVVQQTYAQHIINYGLQDSFTVGGSFGYGFTSNGRYYFGFEMGAQLMPHEANLTNHVDVGAIDDAEDFDVKYNSEMNYNLNFVVTPGAFINDSTLMYAVLGGSYGHVQTSMDFVKNSGDKKNPEQTCKFDQSIWGVVFGGGLRHYVTEHAAIFGEYDYFYYQNEKFDPVDTLPVATGEPQNMKEETLLVNSSYGQSLSVHGGTYKFGVLASFF